MNKRALIGTLIAVQLACVLLGLLVHQRFLMSALDEAGRPESPLAARDPLVGRFDAERLLPTIWGISGLTAIWTNGLMALAAYLLVSRVFDQSGSRRDDARAETLRRVTALTRAQDAVIFGLAKLADSRDADTGGHLERISMYSSALAWAVRNRGLYRDVVTPAFVQQIGSSSALHDIGKVGIEDAILRKTGTLTPAERLRIQEHTRIGDDCLKEIERRMGTTSFLQMERDITLSHHERWDGEGYPAALRGEQIPVAARIVAIADVYDALSSRRLYKDALPHAHCVEHIRSESGRHFDPQLVEAFLEIEPTFNSIARQFVRREDPLAPVDDILRQIQRELSAGDPQLTACATAMEMEPVSPC